MLVPWPRRTPSGGGAPEDRLMLTVRTKLILGFGSLLLLLILLGYHAITLLDRLGGAIDVILRENYRSVVAAQEMKEALERMDSGALFALAGDPGQGRALAKVNGPRFAAALDKELHTITLPGEQEQADAVSRAYAAYSQTLAAVLDPNRPLAERRQLYFGRLFPLFTEIKRGASAILDMNEKNMVDANDRARRVAAAARGRMIALEAGGTALAAALVLLLSRSLLVPLSRLHRSVGEIEGGNLDLVVPVTSRDELGELARAFNAMTARLRELRQSDRAQLLRAQQTAQLAIDALPDAVAVLSPEGEVELANKAAVAALGLAPGQPPAERHAAWLKPLLAAAAHPQAGREPREDAAEEPLPLGPERLYLPTATPIRDAAGRLAGIALFLTDVTRRSRLEALRGQALAEYERERRAAQGDAVRLSRLLERLLAASRLEGRRQQLRLEVRPVADVVDGAIAALRPAFADRRLNLSVAGAPDLPPVAVDPPRLGLALTRLLDNALRHTDAGGAVTVRAEPCDGGVRIAVEDTGHGIPAEFQDRVFDRFFQVPGTEDDGGVGLGLAIAREIVEAHYGTVGVESAVGRGATVWLTLPAAAATPQGGARA